MGSFLFAIVAFCQLHTSQANVLTQVGRIYLPEESLGETGIDGAESLCIDTIHSLIFSANSDKLTIDVTSFDASEDNIKNEYIPITLIKSIDIKAAIKDFDDIDLGDVTGVTYSTQNQLVYAVAAPDNVADDVGYLIVIDPSVIDSSDSSDSSEQDITQIISLTECYLPDHVTTTSDGKNIIIACEGEANDNEVPDPTSHPAGSVAVVTADDYLVVNVKFNQFNEGGPKDLPIGIYQPYTNETFEINCEPEYSVVDSDDKFAYIVLQENNGIAVLDIEKREIIDIYALGFIDYSEYGLDASDKDSAINIQTYPNLYGLRMPDGISFVQTNNGKQYILTANEGDSKDFDEKRVKDIDLDPIAFPNATALQLDENLGRLKIINQYGKNAWGKNDDGEFEELYAFNSRDFTIYEIIKDDDSVVNIELVYSSLNQFEQILKDELGVEGFNSNNNQHPSPDKRSDDKGCEPETITVGKCCNNDDEGSDSSEDDESDGTIYAFIGLERVGGIMVYDITDLNNPDNVQFVEYLNDRNFTVEYGDDDERPPFAAGDIAPEQVVFIDANVYGVPLLFVAYTESSSISIYTVNCECD